MGRQTNCGSFWLILETKMKFMDYSTGKDNLRKMYNFCSNYILLRLKLHLFCHSFINLCGRFFLVPDKYIKGPEYCVWPSMRRYWRDLADIVINDSGGLGRRKNTDIVPQLGNPVFFCSKFSFVWVECLLLKVVSTIIFPDINLATCLRPWECQIKNQNLFPKPWPNCRSPDWGALSTSTWMKDQIPCLNFF